MPPLRERPAQTYAAVRSNVQGIREQPLISGGVSRRECSMFGENGCRFGLHTPSRAPGLSQIPRWPEGGQGRIVSAGDMSAQQDSRESQWWFTDRLGYRRSIRNTAPKRAARAPAPHETAAHVQRTLSTISTLRRGSLRLGDAVQTDPVRSIVDQCTHPGGVGPWPATDANPDKSPEVGDASWTMRLDRKRRVLPGQSALGVEPTASNATGGQRLRLKPLHAQGFKPSARFRYEAWSERNPLPLLGCLYGSWSSAGSSDLFTTGRR